MMSCIIIVWNMTEELMLYAMTQQIFCGCMGKTLLRRCIVGLEDGLRPTLGNSKCEFQSAVWTMWEGLADLHHHRQTTAVCVWTMVWVRYCRHHVVCDIGRTSCLWRVWWSYQLYDGIRISSQVHCVCGSLSLWNNLEVRKQAPRMRELNHISWDNEEVFAEGVFFSLHFTLIRLWWYFISSL